MSKKKKPIKTSLPPNRLVGISSIFSFERQETKTNGSFLSSRSACFDSNSENDIDTGSLPSGCSSLKERVRVAMLDENEKGKEESEREKEMKKNERKEWKASESERASEKGEKKIDFFFF